MSYTYHNTNKHKFCINKKGWSISTGHPEIHKQCHYFIKWARDKFTSNTIGQTGKGQKTHGGVWVSTGVTLITVAGDSCPSNVMEGGHLKLFSSPRWQRVKRQFTSFRCQNFERQNNGVLTSLLWWWHPDVSEHTCVLWLEPKLYCALLAVI